MKKFSQTSTRFSEDIDWSKRFIVPGAIIAMATKSTEECLSASTKSADDCLAGNDEEPDNISTVKWQCYPENDFMVTALSPFVVKIALLQNNIYVISIFSAYCHIFDIKIMAASRQTVNVLHLFGDTHGQWNTIGYLLLTFIFWRCYE